MKTIGFPISHKENENRRTIVPENIIKLSHPENIFIEKDYGDVLGITNKEYEDVGCNVVTREEVRKQKIICDPKIGDAEYLNDLVLGQSIFGWIHATQNREITDKIIKNRLTAYAWENMFEHGRHVFWFNNELAGEAAVINAFQCYGELPYGLKVAVIGNGNTARGAVRALNMLGANVVQYNRRAEQLLRDEISQFDAIVNCVLWDVERKDHIIYKSDLLRMKKNALLIDVSCDKNGGIETSVPTTISDPIYSVNGIVHYVVDHTPSLFFKTFSYNNSKVIYPYIEQLMSDTLGEVLNNSCIIKEGRVIDQKINLFQSRNYE